MSKSRSGNLATCDDFTQRYQDYRRVADHRPVVLIPGGAGAPPCFDLLGEQDLSDEEDDVVTVVKFNRAVQALRQKGVHPRPRVESRPHQPARKSRSEAETTLRQPALDPGSEAEPTPHRQALHPRPEVETTPDQPALDPAPELAREPSMASDPRPAVPQMVASLEQVLGEIPGLDELDPLQWALPEEEIPTFALPSADRPLSWLEPAAMDPLPAIAEEDPSDQEQTSQEDPLGLEILEQTLTSRTHAKKDGDQVPRARVGGGLDELASEEAELVYLLSKKKS